MPDWTYSTVLSPLFRLVPDDCARRFVNGYLRAMTSLPGGRAVLDFLGHMEPPGELAMSFMGVALSSPVTLAPSIDPQGQAVKAFDRFGFGALVLGPVAISGQEWGVFEQGAESLQASKPPVVSPAELPSGQALQARLFVELLLDQPDLEGQMEALCVQCQVAAALIVSARSPAMSHEGLLALAQIAERHEKPLLLGLPDTTDPVEALNWARICAELKIGIWLSGHPCDEGGWEWGGAVERCQRLTREIRIDFPDLALAVDSGVLDPCQALALHQAGADLVGISAGLVHTGPGLPKRINDFLLDQPDLMPEVQSRGPVERTSWFWAALLGLSLLVGAGLAGWVAMTDVVLPYDEEFCGKTGPEIAAFNPRIISFMAHDRITLSGTMVSVGVLYIALAVFEIRRGAHWAQRAVQLSAVSGFISFFAFLGYGYFDPFHAMVAAILCQFLIQLSVLPTGPERRRKPGQSLRNDIVWRQGMWGQLLFVIHASALILAGLIILVFGITEVFVPQDIAYLGMDAGQLAAFGSKLKSLIAHDRATFGGMLVSAGIAILLTTLWGFRRGDAWLWWTYLAVMLTPYLLTLWIHRSIGYWDQFHLLPVYIGLALLTLGLILSRRYFLDGAADHVFTRNLA